MKEEGKQSEYYDELEVMSREERRKYHNRRLREIVKYAYENAPTMKAKFDGAGIAPSEIRTVKNLEKLPITRKDQFVDLYRVNPLGGGLWGLPRGKLRRLFVSPGPIYDPWPISDEVLRRGAKSLYAIGFREGDLVMNTWSYHLTPAGIGYEDALILLGCTVIPAGGGNTELQVQILRDLKVTGWVGTAGFLMIIIHKAEELGYDIRRDFALRVAVPGMEMAGAPIRKTVEEKYGIQTGDMYSLADEGFVAYECRQKEGMHICDELVLEIVDPSTGKQLGPGKMGEVVITSFDETYPLIRFGTGDLASYTDEPCPCGRTSFRMSKIMGRMGDAVRTRGMFVHPRQVNEVASKFPQLSRCQAVVTRPQFRDELALKIELADETVSREKLTADINKVFRDICHIKIDRFEFVPRGTIPEGAKGIVDERVYE